MFRSPLEGLSARLAAASLLLMAAWLTSMCLSYPPIARRLPSWMRIAHWWLFAGWVSCFFAARLLSPE
jgi:hypothetical protein